MVNVPSPRRLVVRLCVVPLVAVLVLGGAGIASAHVTVSPDHGRAGTYAVLTVNVPHGCDGSATNRVAIKIPKQVRSVTPTRHPEWEVDTETTDRDTPVTDEHGNEVTDRVSTVVYTTDDPLPDEQRAAFELSVQLPDTPGTTLVFPTVQTCEHGETAWVETPASGQHADELEHPAPTVAIDSAADEQHAGSDNDSAAADAGTSAPSGWSIAAVVTGGLGLVLAALAVWRTRRRS